MKKILFFLSSLFLAFSVSAQSTQVDELVDQFVKETVTKAGLAKKLSRQISNGSLFDPQKISRQKIYGGSMLDSKLLKQFSGGYVSVRPDDEDSTITYVIVLYDGLGDYSFLQAYFYYKGKEHNLLGFTVLDIKPENPKDTHVAYHYDPSGFIGENLECNGTYLKSVTYLSEDNSIIGEEHFIMNRCEFLEKVKFLYE